MKLALRARILLVALQLNVGVRQLQSTGGRQMPISPPIRDRPTNATEGEDRALRPTRDEALVWGLGVGFLLSVLVVVDPITRLTSPTSAPPVNVDLMLQVIIADTSTFAILFSVVAFLARIVRQTVRAAGSRAPVA